MSVDLDGKSAFPEINAHRDRLKAQIEKLEKEGKQATRKYKRAHMALQKMQVMNFVQPGAECLYTPEEFGKTASEEMHPADAYLAGYCLGMNKTAEDECLRDEPGTGQKENEEAGLPARGMGRKTGSGRKRQILDLLIKSGKKD